MKSVSRSLSVLLVFALAASVQKVSVAQSEQTVDGQWIVQLGKRTLFVLILRSSDQSPGHVIGTISRPTRFTTGDAVSFSNIEGPTEVDPIMESHWEANTLSFTTQSPKEPAERTAYRLTPKDKDHVEVNVEGIPLPPITFVRSEGGGAVSDDWRVGERYSPDDDVPSNPKMKIIFNEDQRVRKSYPKIDWPTVEKSDAVRRAETMKLLTAGSLHSGDDFTWAAFVFQHGSQPEDFLLAHTLALVAVRKGSGGASWIASASLDRYLQSIKQPQIYGTQFLTPDGKAASQNPYNQTLVPDALRRQLGVPDLAAQEMQRQQYDTDRHLGGKNTK